MGARTNCRNRSLQVHMSGARGVHTRRWFRYVGQVLWLGRPPYLRWLAAGALIVGALVWDLSERATEPFPFAASDLDRGHQISAADLRWHNMPVGVLAMPDLVNAIPLVPIRAGDPIVASLVSPSPALPPNSWAVPVQLPVGTHVGTVVKLVFADGSDVDGLVMQPAREDSFGFETIGLVAVADREASTVALAAANGDLVVLVEP